MNPEYADKSVVVVITTTVSEKVKDIRESPWLLNLKKSPSPAPVSLGGLEAVPYNSVITKVSLTSGMG